MRRIFLLILLAALARPAFAMEASTQTAADLSTTAASGVLAGAKEVVPKLLAVGIPEIPAATVERLRQYQNTRSAWFQDWTPGGGMLIGTRFGETVQVHRIDRPMGARHQLTFESEPVGGVRSGAWLGEKGFFYLKDVGGGEAYQVFHFAEASGRHELLSDGKSRYKSLRLSRDGRRLAVSSNKRNGKDFDIYILDLVKGGEPRLVMKTEGWWGAVDWSPDGRELLVKHYVSAAESSYHRLDPASGWHAPLFPDPGRKIAYGSARYAADGKGVYFVSDRWGEFLQLGFVGFEDRALKRLSSYIPWDIRGLEVGPKGRWIAFTANEGGRSKLRVWRFSKKKPPKEMRLPEMPAGLLTGLEFDGKGERLAFTVNSSRGPGDVYSLDIKSRKLSRWTRSEVGGLDTSLFIAPKLIHYPTFDKFSGQARRIPAFLYLPEGPGPFPVVVKIHGGPESQYRPWFSPQIQYWVNELELAVLAPNVRGSSGYGKSYLTLDNGFKREDSVKDIGALLNWIFGRPELDASRVGVYGGSYGGYMVLAALARYPDKLRAGVDVVGISNFVTFLKNTKDYRRDLRRAEYGDERNEDMRVFLESISPTNLTGSIKSPLFVVQGANDPRVPASEAAQIVSAVKAGGNPVWYLLAEDEGHGFRKKKNKDYYRSAVSLFWE
ncbi:MAG: alpha/beta fold hydrolase, partial [Elusimicrobiota bacterium]